MENLISIILLVCIASFIYALIKLKKLISTGEVNIFNVMFVKDLSSEAEAHKKHALIGVYTFVAAILLMLIITGIYGPVKG